MNNKRLTSVELAKLAGVSPATVSRAFAANARINQRTRDHILAIAKEHGYRPNAIARSLNLRETRLVALVVNSIDGMCEAEQLNELVLRLQSRELMPIVLCCGRSSERMQLMRLASTYQLDYAVIISDMVSVDDALEIFQMGKPIIVSNEPIDRPGISQLRIDGSVAADEIVAALVANGRRHFAFLAGRTSSWIDKQRRAWFADALRKRGLRFEAEGQGDFTYDSGYKEAVLMLRRHHVDALICGNDAMAIGAQDAARYLLQRKIPTDLAIVGQDGIAMASWDSHNLTTLALDNIALVDAIMSLIERDRRGDKQADELVLHCSVRWGTSTEPAAPQQQREEGPGST